MSLRPGTRLGPYEIGVPLGAGGMGEVYRARDTKLEREVALKVLPSAFAADPDRMARFEREARLLASLNHPNIATLFGLEDSEGVRALAMELVEGPTLAGRIDAGPLPLDEAIPIALQIIEALDYAHDRGIIHRDLKPTNVKVTPEGVVKLLDFGLAKALADEPESAPSPDSPTLSMGATRAGVILGTAAYMAPEQVNGKRADRRADIWAFGVVLFEMLTGKRPFEGETTAEILSSVMKDRPSLEEVPAPVRPLVARCLEKSPRQRLQAIGEARLALEKPASAVLPLATAPSRSRLSLAACTVAGVLLLIAGAATWIAWRATRPVERPLMRLSVDLGPEAVAGNATTVAISRDGTRIAFPVRGPGGGQQLATRLLEQATPTILAGTDNGRDPFFSPDGQWIGFFAEGKLKKISVLGGAALALCDAPAGRGASWGDDGNIIAALTSITGTGLSLVPAAGGPPQPLTKPFAIGEITHRLPKVVPGSAAVLFSGTSTNSNWEDANIEVLSRQTGAVKILLRGGYFPDYLPSSSGLGRLVYVHQGVLFGVPFDPGRLEIRGAPAPLLEDVAANAGIGGGQFAVSQSGTLVYQSGKSSAGNWPVMWLDGSGKTQPLLAKPGLYFTPRVSPDGTRVALSVVAGKGRDIYVYDWQHDTMPRLTFTGASNSLPVWTPDGKHIVYAAQDGLWWVRADGAGEPERLLESKTVIFGNSFSPDGKRFSYSESSPDTGSDIWTVPLDLADPNHPKPGKPEPFLRTPATEAFSMFSPDGRWMAYSSDESGQPEVFVRPFPGPGGKWQISAGGGAVPVWSRNGRDLFYVSPDNRIMVTAYTAHGDSFSFVKPRLWSDTPINATTGNRYYDLHPDGKRFAVFPTTEAGNDKPGNLHATFLLHFADEVRRRVPEGK